MVAANDNVCPCPLTGRTVLICLIIFFAVISIVNGIMIRAAISTFAGVETGSSYQAGLAFAHEADAARAQDERHWQVKANIRRTDGKTLLEIDARDAAGSPLAGLEATAVLHHPTNGRADHTVSLSESGSGRFSGDTVAAAGQWDLMIDLTRNGERVFRSRNRVMLQ